VELRIAFVGFGNVARSFARMLSERRAHLDEDYGLRWKTTAIATGAHGCITSDVGIDLVEAVACVERGGSLTDLAGTAAASGSAEVVAGCKADILLETTPLDIVLGEPATTYVRTALTRGLNVVTANKGPVAFAYAELKAIAVERGVCFHFEGAVMDGAPVFNLVERCLPGARVLGFSGVLNSTSNLILTEMEAGRSFEDALREARRRGITEVNADYDIDGWDAAVKAVALANVLMTADARPAEVDRQGIRGVSIADIESARADGNALRLVARGERSTSGTRLTVRPERVPSTSILGSVRGTSNALVLQTDLMGEIAIIENDPGIEQTAYALLSDMIAVHERAARR
jgi:homoserine dehydrogenase